MTNRQRSSLRPREIAMRYGVGVTKVLGWIRSGELKALDVSTAGDGSKPRWRVLESEIEAFEKKRSSGKPSSPKRRRKRKSIAAGIEDVFA